ncbi:MAG: helicase-associated domain-containing protein [Planctomycetes bacterium]|nr:helicase-associated domain-containing protein [Planctomycetota bacterium]
MTAGPGPATGALWLEADGTVLLDQGHPGAGAAEALLRRCAGLVRAPEPIATWQLDAHSLHAAADAGLGPEDLLAALAAHAAEPLPAALADRVRAWCAAPVARPDPGSFVRGRRLAVRLRERDAEGRPFAPRCYQEEAAQAFARAGAGVVVLPCGAGKTLVGIRALTLVQERALVLAPSREALEQWRRELLARTDLAPDQVVAAQGADPAAVQAAGVVLATYQRVTWRQGRLAAFAHLASLAEQDFGLVIYDEAHLLPAPVFRATAGLQARRRLGLTATPVREDGREHEVHALLGPRLYQMPWRRLERDGFLAPVDCVEVRVPASREGASAPADARGAFRRASTDPAKHGVLDALLRRHSGQGILVIGQYLDQLHALAARLGAPLLTGATPHAEREARYAEFRAGAARILVLSRIANLAIDLPDAEVLIAVSGAFGSRQEEAQRLGRVLRPKRAGGAASFYALVSAGSVEQECARRRQRFLVEQGYRYRVVEATGAAWESGAWTGA